MLAVYQPGKQTIRSVVPSQQPLRMLGISGLARSEDHIFVATQAGLPLDPTGKFFTQSYLFILARDSLKLVASHRLQQVKDAHSICYLDGRLYIASSGTDEIIELLLNGTSIVSENVFWRLEPDGPAMDMNHINGICTSPDGLIVTGFGRRSEETRQWASNGFVFNITRNQLLASGLEQPHSPISLGGKSIAYCESSRRTLRIAGEDRELVLPGYSRGICQMGAELYVGTSVRRTVSRSTGAAVIQTGGGPANPDLCTINRVSAAEFSLLSSVTLGLGLSEIYDFLPI